jgi:hypothetical protein
MTQALVLPQLVVEAFGMALPDDVVRALAEVRVQQRLGLPAQCELTFSDPPGALDGIAERLMPGVALRVLVGVQHAALFAGEVTAVEHVYGATRGRRCVRGYDRLRGCASARAARARAGDVGRPGARDGRRPGLTVQADEHGPLWKHLIQHRQSDFELLTEMAGACGLYLVLRDDTLHC